MGDAQVSYELIVEQQALQYFQQLLEVSVTYLIAISKLDLHDIFVMGVRFCSWLCMRPMYPSQVIKMNPLALPIGLEIQKKLNHCFHLLF